MTCIWRVCLCIFVVTLPTALSTDDARAAPQSNSRFGAMRGVTSEARARLNYALNCQGCHLGDGAGMPGRVPAIAGFVSRFLSAPGGREYLVRVPGVTNAAVNDEELAEIANWMLYTFDPQHLPDDFAPYTEKEIAAGRAHPYTVEAADIRRRLLAALKNEQESGKSLDTSKQGRSAK